MITLWKMDKGRTEDISLSDTNMGKLLETKSKNSCHTTVL